MTYAGQGRRTQAERDAITVETGYALFSAAFAAAVVFGAVAGPALLLTLPATVERVLVIFGSALATALFFVRVASVLLRFRRAGDPVPHPERRTAGPQPGRPGRTHPDS